VRLQPRLTPADSRSPRFAVETGAERSSVQQTTRGLRHFAMEHGAPVVKRNLEGEQSPWEDRLRVRRQRWAWSTDPTVEQGLEADARLACSRHPATDDGDTDGATANGKGATAAAMQYGYWRGDILRGVRNALRGPRQTLDSIQRYRARNVANPRVGSRMQQACEPFAAETGEVVRNHEVGTRWMSLGAHSPKPDESSSGGSGRKR